MSFLLILVGAILTTMLIAGRASPPRRAVIAGGQRVRGELAGVYTRLHRYEVTDAASFPHVDQAWFSSMDQALTGNGFVRISDLENKTISELHPDGRSFLRVWSADGVVRASAYWVGPMGGIVPVLGLLHVRPLPLRVIELVSEFPDGTVLSTSNTLGVERLDVPDKLKAQRLPTKTGVAELVDTHRRRLAEAMRARPHVLPRTLDDTASIIDSLVRVHELAADHRKAQAGLSRDELERLRGRPLDDKDLAFLAAVQGKPEA